MISAVRLVKILPYVALAALAIQFTWMWSQTRSQAVEISQLEAKLAERATEIRSLEEDAAAADARLRDTVEILEAAHQATRAELEGERDLIERMRATQVEPLSEAGRLFLLDSVETRE